MVRALESLPQLPNLRAYIGVVLAAPGGARAKPPNELFMHHSTDLLSGGAASKPRKDRAHLRIILIRVRLEVDPHRVVAE